MRFTYPALFHEEDGQYWVEFPDLDGCQTYGDNLNETIEYAQEALAAYVLTMLEADKQLVAPSDIKNFVNLDDGTFSSLVTCDVDQYKETKAVKKTLTIPSWLNDRALAQGINFSKVLQEGLLQKIGVK